MPSDIRMEDDSVIVEGKLLLGTSSAERPVHVEGGEIHTGGPAGGFSFSDRGASGFQDVPSNGQRWVWYANGGRAQLWSGVDALAVQRKPGSSAFTASVNGDVAASGTVSGATLSATAVLASTVHANGTITGSTVKLSGALDAASVVTASANVNGNLIAKQVSAGTLNATDLKASNVTATTSIKGPKAAFDLEVKAPRVVGAIVEVTDRLLAPAPPTGVPVRAIARGANAIALNDPAAPTSVPATQTELVPGRPATAAPGAVEDPPPPKPEPTVPVAPRLALFHDFGPGRDGLVINHLRRYPRGVTVDGDLTVTGTFAQASSRALKDDVQQLPVDAAMAALDDLRAVTYRYRADDSGARHVGFIAEDVPDLVAQPGRDRVGPMDVVAVLTTVVQAQQRAVAELTAAVAALQAR